MIENTALLWRWETEARWYEAELLCDMFGDWVVIRSWGGMYSGLRGTKTDVVADMLSGVALLYEIDRERGARKPPYMRVVGV